jgi:AraC-like DNA-binding protein
MSSSADPPDLARDVADLLRASATAEAVSRTEDWVRQALNRRVQPRLLFGVWLPGLVIEVAATLDPGRSPGGSANWRSALAHVPVADLAALGTLHERSQLRHWLTHRFTQLATVAGNGAAGDVAGPGILAERAERLLRRRFTDPGLTLNRAASALCVSPFHLAHVLQRERNTTFRRYLTGLRVGKAVGLLSRGELRVGEIARLCGFASPRQFRATIRRETGQTPTQLRLHALWSESGHEPADVAAQYQSGVGGLELGEDHAAQ